MFGTFGWQRRGAEMNGLYTTLERFRPYILSILRIVIGLLFLQHGLSKVFNFPAPSPVPSLSGIFILAAILETIGAALFLVGAFTRIVAFILSGEMAFAYFMGHAPRSFYPVVNGGELAVLFCFVFLYFAFAGGGPLSVDRAMLKQA
jgi:putative oxidoreductase